MIQYSLPLAEYHGSTAISGSKLKERDEMRCARDYYRKYIAKTSKPRTASEAFIIGQLFEDFIQRGEAEYVASLAAVKWPKQKGAEAIARKVEESDALIRAMIAAREKHQIAEQCRKHGMPQVTFSITICGVVVQCRPDWWFPNGLDGCSEPCWGDEKTSVGLRWFDSDLVDLKYHWSAWLNRFVITKALQQEYGEAPEALDGFFIVTDKDEEEPMTQIKRLEPQHYAAAERALDKTQHESGLLSRLIMEYVDGNWPSVEPISFAKAPRWMKEATT